MKAFYIKLKLCFGALLISAAICGGAWASSPFPNDAKACKAVLRSALAKWNIDPGAIQKGQSAYMHIQVASTPRDTKNFESSQSDVRFWTNAKGWLKMETDQMVVLKDNRHCAVVVPQRKAIYLQSIPKDETPVVDMAQSLDFQKKAIETGAVSGCEEFREGGKLLRKIVLELDEKLSLHSNVLALEFFMDMDAGAVEKVTVKYSSTSPVATAEYRYLAWEPNHRESVLNTGVVRTLKQAAYADYKLIDQTN